MNNKIAFIGPLPPPLGGVAVINESIQKIEFDNFQIVSFNTSAEQNRENLYAGFKLKSLKRNILLSSKLAHFIEKEQPKVINIFVTSGLSIIRDIVFLRTLSKYRIPIIIHFHSKTKGEFALVPWRLKIVAKYFNKYASKIILLSDFHCAFFSKYFKPEKCTVLENFVRYSDFQNQISQKNNTFLFVGRLSKEKGFFDLIEAVNILKQKEIKCTVKVIGLAPSDLIEKEIKSMITKFQLVDYLEFKGAVFGNEKFELFKQSFCLVFPSHFENSPVVIKEAIAAKMAILASDIQPNKNILEKHNNYLCFESENPLALAERMESILSNKTKVIEMCEDSERIKDYDVSFAKQKLTSLFTELINQ
ncbi:MAG: glycosyltransferase [Flavobacteriales bacterium]|nr:glycosyltransferase [Flavobacteriales bacterium]